MKKYHDNDSDETLVPEQDVIIPEDTDLETEEKTVKDTLKSLRTKLKICEKEKMEHLEALQRTRADYLNSKRRLEEGVEKEKERLTVKHVEALLPLCDSFESAMRDQNAWEAQDATWRKGIEGIHRELMNILARYNVASFGISGEHFDPTIHEAVGEEMGEPEKVTLVVQKGYRKGETIIRPARVIVGKN